MKWSDLIFKTRPNMTGTDSSMTAEQARNAAKEARLRAEKKTEREVFSAIKSQACQGASYAEIAFLKKCEMAAVPAVADRLRRLGYEVKEDPCCSKSVLVIVRWENSDEME